MKLYEMRYLDGEEKRVEWDKKHDVFSLIGRQDGVNVDLITLSRQEARKLTYFLLDCLGEVKERKVSV